MEIVIIVFVSLILGIFLAFTSVWWSAHKKSRHSSSDKKQMETMKKVIWICLINGFAWVWCSYILAYLDKVQIAESLSQAAVTEIIGVVLAYSIKSAVENLSKHNFWPDKESSENMQDDGEEDSYGKQ